MNVRNAKAESRGFSSTTLAPKPSPSQGRGLEKADGLDAQKGKEVGKSAD